MNYNIPSVLYNFCNYYKNTPIPFYSTDSEATAPPSSASDRESPGSDTEWRVGKSRSSKPQRKARSRRRRRDSSGMFFDMLNYFKRNSDIFNLLM